MSLLTQVSAEKIVRRLQRIIPNTLRVMDINGRLLAVCGAERDDLTHMNALRAVDLQEAVIVYRDSEYEQQGISFPVRYNDRIEGVVEINGDIDQVMQMGQTVVTLVELMIENDVYHEHTATR